jgi:hypothetical protein
MFVPAGETGEVRCPYAMGNIEERTYKMIVNEPQRV